jgi:hypothetical protein
MNQKQVDVIVSNPFVRHRRVTLIGINEKSHYQINQRIAIFNTLKHSKLVRSKCLSLKLCVCIIENSKLKLSVPNIQDRSLNQSLLVELHRLLLNNGICIPLCNLLVGINWWIVRSKKRKHFLRIMREFTIRRWIKQRLKALFRTIFQRCSIHQCNQFLSVVDSDTITPNVNVIELSMQILCFKLYHRSLNRNSPWKNVVNVIFLVIQSNGKQWLQKCIENIRILRRKFSRISIRLDKPTKHIDIHNVCISVLCHCGVISIISTLNNLHCFKIRIRFQFSYNLSKLNPFNHLLFICKCLASSFCSKNRFRERKHRNNVRFRIRLCWKQSPCTKTRELLS